MARYLTCVLMFVVFAAGVVACRSGQKELTALERLAAAADAHGYWNYGHSVAVPYSAFSARDLQGWEKISQERMHVPTDGAIYKITSDFDDAGEKIIGVSINWHGSQLTAGFPYPLNEEETSAFVKKAIREMQN